ncbi:MAG: hypothetical protein EBS55_15125 [Flavobacteriaceae bacterium]|nr:hypothetical protein [Flavobacteriaceae bacterium]
MKEIIITSRQRMLSPDILAYELGQIPTPEKIENTKIATYVLIGVFATITIGVISYTVYQIHQESKSRKQN